MKKIFLLSVLSFFSLIAVSQKTGKMFLPAMSAATPSWFRVFYDDNFPKGVDLIKLDREAAEYEQALQRSAKNKRSVQNATGEETKDFYILYYKRWQKSHPFNIKPENTSTPASYSTKPATKRVPSGINRSVAPPPGSSWSIVGPKSMRQLSQDNPAQPPFTWQTNIYACAIAPSNPDILFATPEAGGIFKTTNKGLHWFSVSDDYPFNEFYSLAIHPSNPDLVFAGRYNSIAWTNDGGTTWNDVPVPSGTVNQLLIKPSNPDHLFAASENGLFQSTDAGLTWSLSGGISSSVYDLQFQPFNDDVIYALIRQGALVEFWKSTNNGLTFSPSLNGWTGSGVSASSSARMTVTPADSNRIYAVVLADAPNVPFIFKSVDGGLTWISTCSGTTDFTGNNASPLGMSNGQGYYDLAILANPLNADEVIVGTTSAYKSTDGGLTFQPLGGYIGPIPIHPDIQWMTSNGNDTWIATDGGMNLSTDFFSGISNYSSRTDGEFGTEIWGFTQGWNEDIIAGGRYHNGNMIVSEKYPNGTGVYVGGGEAATGYYMFGRERHMAFSDLGGGIVAPDSLHGSVSYFSFPQFPNEDYYGYDVSEIEFWPSCYNQLFMGKGNELWRSEDGGISWVTVFNFNERVKKFDLCRNQPNVFYLATDQQLYRSNDTGATWTILPLPSGTTISLLRLTVSPHDANKLWIASPYNPPGSRVFKSTDGGLSWINLTSATVDNENVLALAAQAGTNDGVYCMADHGNCFYRNNSMTDWAIYNDSLPAGFYTMYLSPFFRDGKIRAAGNRGVWEIDLFEPSTPVAQPTVNRLNSFCERDTIYFNDFSALHHQLATWNWSFNPAPQYVSSTTVRNPKVVTGSAGNMSATLTVTNPYGSDSKTLTINTLEYCTPDTLPGKTLTLSNNGDYATQLSGYPLLTNTFSISCWIKPSGIQDDWSGIVFNSNASGLNFFTQNKIGYHWADSPQSYNWWNGPTVPADEWSHLALVVTPDSATVYLNGVAHSNVQPQPLSDLSTPFSIGNDSRYSNRNFRGQIDEVCCYNRSLSQSEVREMMNLTRNNPNAAGIAGNDTSLLSYYQFNEPNTISPTDRAGVNPLSLIQNAHLSNPSTAPVGGGVSQTQSITTGGNASFPIPGIQLGVSNSGLAPNGEVVVTRLNVSPDIIPNQSTPAGQTRPYYILRNYGTNAVFADLDSLRFENIEGLPSSLSTSPEGLKLYRRDMNADGPVWLSPVDSATAVNQSGTWSNVHFNNGISVNRSAQLALGYDSLIISVGVAGVPAYAHEIRLFPNPTATGWISFAFKDTPSGKNVRINVSNEAGQKVKEVILQNVKSEAVYHLYLPSPGVYFMSFFFDDGKLQTKRIIVSN